MPSTLTTDTINTSKEALILYFLFTPISVMSVTNQELQERRELMKTAKDYHLIPETSNMIEAVQLLTPAEKITLKNYINFAVRIDSDVFFVSPNQLVPSHASVIKSSTNQLLGISPVSGG